MYKLPYIIPVLLLMIDFKVSEAPGPWFEYAPSIVTLSGTIQLETIRNSTSFDQEMTLPILILDHPVNVKGNTSGAVDRDTITDVKEMEIDDPYMGLQQYVGKHVSIQATLSEGIVGARHTRVSIWYIRKIELTEAKHRPAAPEAGARSGLRGEANP